MWSCIGTTRGADEASDRADDCNGRFCGESVVLGVAADMVPVGIESGGVGICLEWSTEGEVV